MPQCHVFFSSKLWVLKTGKLQFLIEVAHVYEDGMSQRADGRGQEEFRPLFLQTRVLNQAKGSSYIELDKTKVMVGV